MHGLRFPKSESDSRVKAARAAMQERNIDLLAVFSAQGSMRYGQRGHVMYLSGYEPYFGNTMMILSREENHESLLMIDSADYFPSDCTWVEATENVQDPVALIERYLETSGMNDATIGVVGEYSVDSKLMDRMRSELGEDRIVVASDILERARSVKSSYEIECISQAVRIAEKGFEALRERAVEGIGEASLVGEVEKAWAKLMRSGSTAASSPTSRRTRAMRPGPCGAAASRQLRWISTAMPISCTSRSVAGKPCAGIAPPGWYTRGPWTDPSRSARPAGCAPGCAR